MTNPFTLGELDKLQDAYMHNDCFYIYEWTKRATEYHEKEKQSIVDAVELIHMWEPREPGDNYHLQSYWDQLLEILVCGEQRK